MRMSALLVALLACATVVAGDTASVCDGVICGMGTCTEVPPLVPFLSNASTPECDCYPGWRRLFPIPAFTPCYIPICPSDLTCYIPSLKLPPTGSNVTLNPCLFMDCGLEGTCVEEENKPLRCQCNPGASNSLNDPSLPCTKGCVIGEDGCPVPNPPPPPPAPPSSSSSMAPPGSVRLGSLLLLASLAVLHVV